jgi:hypothetical protein
MPLTTKRAFMVIPHLRQVAVRSVRARRWQSHSWQTGHSGFPQAEQGKRRVVLVAWQVGQWNVAWWPRPA